MNDILTSGPRKTLLATVALVALAAGSARAQTNDAPPAGAPDAQPAAPPPAAPPPAAMPAPLPPSPVPAPTPVAAAPNGPVAPGPAEIPSAGPNFEKTWFTRTPLKVTVGSGDQAWSIAFFGTIEADYITDSTRSYNEIIGRDIVARSDTYEGTVGRTQFSMRNTRVGLLLDSPRVGVFTPSAVFQGDFAGNQPGTPYVIPGVQVGSTISENAYYNSPTFRVRHAYLSLKNPYVDILAGQTFDVFGFQNFYLALSLLGLPNQVSTRTAQFRLSRTFGAGGPISVDVAVEAARPVQRDSQVPDLMGGIRFCVNGWKGITTPGNAVTIAAPLSLSVSGVSRQFKVNAFTPPPAQASNHTTGWGVSADLFAPIIPAAHGEDRGNRLSLVGSFVIGTGIADLISAGGGARFPTLPNSMQANPPPAYTADIDNGLVTFDILGVVHTIDWYAAKGGLQYYLPGSGRFVLAGNVTYAHSGNLDKLYPRGGAMIELLGSIANTSLSADGTLMFDATPAVRFGISGQYTQVTYLNDITAGPMKPHNIRGIGQALYIF
jgi:hypothetical protein